MNFTPFKEMFQEDSSSEDKEKPKNKIRERKLSKDILTPHDEKIFLKEAKDIAQQKSKKINKSLEEKIEDLIHGGHAKEDPDTIRLLAAIWLMEEERKISSEQRMVLHGKLTQQ